MSICISRHGEYSSHQLSNLYTCTLCGLLDEDALQNELQQLREQRDRVLALLDQNVYSEAVSTWIIEEINHIFRIKQ